MCSSALAPLIVLAVVGIRLHRGRAPRFTAWRIFLSCGVPWPFVLLTHAPQPSPTASELALYADNVAECPGNAFAQCATWARPCWIRRAERPEAIAPPSRKPCGFAPTYPIGAGQSGQCPPAAGPGRTPRFVGHYPGRPAARSPGFAEAGRQAGRPPCCARVRPDGRHAIFAEARRCELSSGPASRPCNNLANALVGEGQAGRRPSRSMEAILFNMRRSWSPGSDLRRGQEQPGQRPGAAEGRRLPDAIVRH